MEQINVKMKKILPQLAGSLKKKDTDQHRTGGTDTGPYSISRTNGQCFGNPYQKEHTDTQGYQQSE